MDWFDPGKLTDEELREKLANLQQRLWATHAMGMSMEIRDQLQYYVSQIETELMARFAHETQKLWDAQFPEIIESDPEFKPQAEAKKPTTTGKAGKPGVVADDGKPKVMPTFNKTFKQK